MENIDLNFKYKGRHPRILYIFWDEKVIENDKYLKDLEHIAKDSCYTTVAVTARGKMDFFDRKMIPYFEKTVNYAHKLGLKIMLQLWPDSPSLLKKVNIDEAVSVVSENESQVLKVNDCKVKMFLKTDTVRCPFSSVHLKSEILSVYAFKKKGDGKYEEGSLVDVTEIAKGTERDNGIEISLCLPDKENYTVYAMANHYHAYGDLYSDFYPREYRNLMEDLKVPFDSVVLDEFKNIAIKHKDNCHRDRFSGKNSERLFKEKKGIELKDVLFDMRYAPANNEAKRINAINVYFEWMRGGTKRVEKILADYSREFCGKDAFLGLHNTFHNNFDNDEIWATGCNWWEVPRDYAQTDENIGMPVRMGISCQCKEAIHYDMFYKRDKEEFYFKALEDARFGGRIHYHAMNDKGTWGVDLGREDFLSEMNIVEKKVNLLNIFDGPMPKLDLLIVFGMPALCNWYPDISARNDYDLNGKLGIMSKVNYLWKNGCRCALAPSEAVDDGRVKMTENGFDYCGHKFSALLYLYPQYAKKTNVDFIVNSVESSKNVRVIGDFTNYFDGQKASFEIRKLISDVTILEDENVIKTMNLPICTKEDECILEDGSYVYSNRESVKNNSYREISCKIGENLFEGSYIGCAGIKCSSNGEIEKFVCGGFKELKRNGKTIFSLDEPKDVYYKKGDNALNIL